MTFEQAIGGRLRQVREEAGARQEDLAAAARLYGASWTRATIAAIELARKKPTLGDLALLLLALKDVGGGNGRRLNLGDLIPKDPTDEVMVEVGPGYELPIRIARGLLLEGDGPAMPAKTKPGPDRRALEAAGDAEQKAAIALGVSPAGLVEAAHRRWRPRGLTAERDRRVVAYTTPMLKADPAEATGPGWPRRLQAIRGHVTRELLEELRPLLKGITKKKRRTR